MVHQVIGGAVDASEVTDLFAAAGLDAARLDILADEFLSRSRSWNKRTLHWRGSASSYDHIRVTERKNLVMSRKFREALEDAMLRYTNKQITTAEMISRRLDLAKWVREQQKHGQDLGMSEQETAFYDALAENGSAKDIMKMGTLRLMARQLAEMVKSMPTLDWTQRESARAGRSAPLTCGRGNADGNCEFSQRIRSVPATRQPSDSHPAEWHAVFRA